MSNDIYSYIKENFGIEVTDYQFKRDYIKEPLKHRQGRFKGERPDYEDINYLYNKINLTILNIKSILNCDRRIIEEIIKKYNLSKPKNKKPSYQEIFQDYIENNLSLNDISKKYNLCKRTVQYYLNQYKIKKPNHLISMIRKQTCLEKYGNENYVNIEKYKQTCLEKYGVDNPSKLNEIQNIKKENCKKKTGYDWYSQSPNFKRKTKQTLLKKYGNENYVNIEKYKQTCLEKYGVDNISKLEDIKRKKKETCFRHYGTKHYIQSEIGINHYKQTCLEKYGVEYYFQSNEFKKLFKNEDFINMIQYKIHETMKKNKTEGKSKQEDEIYNLLIQKYPNTIRQYISDLYPYYCDFYIPELDLYIEYQGYWKHGKEPYIGTDEQKEIIKLWEEKSKEINFKGELKEEYSDAIKRWTISDPLKRETAKKNNLNWIEFFNMNEFMNWYSSL